MTSYPLRPYLIIPKLIEQPTWGGAYILKTKKWNKKSYLQDKKIGQSYELFGQSKLLIHITDSADPGFIPEFGFADRPETVRENFDLASEADYFVLDDFVASNQHAVIGKKIFEKYGKMPLLNKLTQALGNSFQIHVKPDVRYPRWQPKPESWFYFEDGLITCGLKKDCDLVEYKKVCVEINKFMQDISTRVLDKKLDMEEAKKKAHEYIYSMNPWQFVNSYEPKKDELIDLSKGGLHHSWEQDMARFPQGNILYEVQQDVMDPVSTIRAFDQGKLKSDGTIRELNIDDYFQLIDRDPTHNDVANMRIKRAGNKLLKTPYYSLDYIEVNDSYEDRTNDSFAHLFVKEGDVEISTDSGNVHLTQGHSCFVPAAVNSYHIKSQTRSVLLKTFIEL